MKPTAMLQDALIDLTNRGEIVLDPFLGSGSTLIAAENTGRVCHGVELDPLYIDVIIRRYETVTGAAVTVDGSGETFEQLVARRANKSYRKELALRRRTRERGRATIRQRLTGTAA